MAQNSAQTPQYEYTKGDVNIIVVFNDGELPLADRWESATLTPNGESATLPGSGQFERAHGKIYYKPELSITLDVDLAHYITKRANGIPIKQVKLVRQRPGAAPITDLVNGWQVPVGAVEYGDDVATVEMTGRALSFKLDSTNKIATPQT